jgi:hypothetical protein
MVVQSLLFYQQRLYVHVVRTGQSTGGPGAGEHLRLADESN